MRVIQTLLAAAILVALVFIARDLRTIANLTPRLAPSSRASSVPALTPDEAHEQRVQQAMRLQEEMDDQERADAEAAARLRKSRR